jgi:Xaa-Pro aminopeptidase
MTKPVETFTAGFESRIENLRQSMLRLDVEACLVICSEGRNWENVFYLSGFRGSSSGLVVSHERIVLVTDARYLRQAQFQTALDVREQGKDGLVESLKGVLCAWGIHRAAFEHARVSHSLGLSLSGESTVTWVDGSSLFAGLRRTKTPAEIALIREAARACSAALEETLPWFRPGVTERELGARVEFSLRLNGAEGGWGGHEFVVASGLRSALPHGLATGKPVEAGEWVTLDFGARVGGYLCDITRNIALGKIPGKAKELHGLLLEAQEAAFSVTKAGVKASDVDAAARKVIEKAGYGSAFSHGTGHGVGLELHELPHVSRSSQDVLRAGDVVTIEPGIYIDGFGGLRVEDDCAVTENGAEWLTRDVHPGFLQAL